MLCLSSIFQFPANMSWLKLVKRAFRSPSKAHDQKSSRPREECEPEEEDKKREKRRLWLLRRSATSAGTHVQVKMTTEEAPDSALDVQTRHALAAASARLEAAAATAEAAAEIVKLAQPSRYARATEHYAAVIIQTAFRGYLARRAFHALRGLVKLQALVRGHNVRKQTKLVLKHMLALLRLQDRLLHQQRASLSHQQSRKSMFAETNNVWESKYLQEIHDRESMLRDMRPYTVEDFGSALNRKKAFSNEHQIRRRSTRNQSAGHENEPEDRAKWLGRWMPANPWDNGNRRASTDNHGLRSFPTAITKRCHHQQLPPLSPLHRAHQNLCAHQSPGAAMPMPSPLKTQTWGGLRGEKRSYSAANTPVLGRSSMHSMSLPNYMASTESAKAKARWQSSTRERERDGSGSAKKRLSYTAPETQSQNLRSPSFKSAHIGMDRDSDYSVCYGESQISPCSTTELRWLT